MALRVLLADESSTIKKVFEIGLRDFGLEIRNVQHGVDVMEVAEGFAPDIIFADVLLSKMNGYEVCAQLKQNSNMASVPVVLMWSSFMDIDEDKYVACNADGRLEKPFSAEQLRSKIQSLVPRTLDNKIAKHLQFAPIEQPMGRPHSGSMAAAGSAGGDMQTVTPSPVIPKRNNPAEDLLFKEDLPLETDASPEALDRDTFDSSTDDDFDFDYMDTTSTGDDEMDLSSDEELMDLDPDMDESEFSADSEEVDLTGFQSLDTTEEESSSNWVDGFSEFKIDADETDDVPLDFKPPEPGLEDTAEELQATTEDPDAIDANSDAGFFDLNAEDEVTSVPSLEEEVQLLDKVKEDQMLRQKNEQLVNKPASAQVSAKQNTSSSVKHRTIDDLSPTNKNSTLPPIPNQNPTSNNITVSKEELRAMVKKEAKEMLQTVIWEVVPELAKQMIEKEVKRLLAQDESESKD